MKKNNLFHAFCILFLAFGIIGCSDDEDFEIENRRPNPFKFTSITIDDNGKISLEWENNGDPDGGNLTYQLNSLLLAGFELEESDDEDINNNNRDRVLFYDSITTITSNAFTTPVDERILRDRYLEQGVYTFESQAKDEVGNVRSAIRRVLIDDSEVDRSISNFEREVIKSDSLKNHSIALKLNRISFPFYVSDYTLDIYLDGNLLEEGLPRTQRSYNISGLTPQTIYDIDVVINITSDLLYDNRKTHELNFSAITTNIPPPLNPADVSIDFIGSNGIDISFLEVQDNFRVVYDVFVNGDLDATVSDPDPLNQGSIINYLVGSGNVTLLPETNYEIVVSARNSFDATINTDPISVTTLSQIDFEVFDVNVFDSNTVINDVEVGGSVILKSSNRDIITRVILNGKEYTSFFPSGTNSINFTVDEATLQELIAIPSNSNSRRAQVFIQNGSSEDVRISEPYGVVL